MRAVQSNILTKKLTKWIFITHVFFYFYFQSFREILLRLVNILSLIALSTS